MDKRGQVGVDAQAEPVGASAAPGLVEVAASVGAQLTVLREARGMSIEDVSARLKVAPLKLQRLEAGQWDALPEMPFLQGVVRSYARMLGADPAPLVEPLRRFSHVGAIDIPPPALNAASLPQSPVRFRSPVGSPQAKWPWALAVGVIVAGTIGYFSSGHKPKVADMSIEMASATVPEVAEPASQPVVADANAAPPGGEVNNSGNSENDVAASKKVEGAGAALIAAADPSHGVQTAASGVVGVTSTASAPVAVTAAVAPAPAPASAAAAAVAATGNGKLTLNLKADSWVEVRQRDGRVVFSQLLRGGNVQDITGDAPLKVVIGNVSGVESAQFNGQSLELKARNVGNVARLTLQ